MEKAASCIPQRTARRASRFFWLRLFLKSESESLAASSWESDDVGAFRGLSPCEQRCRFRCEEGSALREILYEFEVSFVTIVVGRRNEERISCGARKQQWCCSRGKCFKGRISQAMLYLMSLSFAMHQQNRYVQQRQNEREMMTNGFGLGLLGSK